MKHVIMVNVHVEMAIVETSAVHANMDISRNGMVCDIYAQVSGYFLCVIFLLHCNEFLNCRSHYFNCTLI